MLDVDRDDPVEEPKVPDVVANRLDEDRHDLVEEPKKTKKMKMMFTMIVMIMLKSPLVSSPTPFLTPA